MADKDPAAQVKAAKESGIRFVQLQFTDIIGIVKAVTIPLHQLEGSIKHGTWFDGRSIEGFTRIAESDQCLKPDMDTFAEIPWQQGIRTARHGARDLRRLHAGRRAVRRRPALHPPAPAGAREEAGLRLQHRPGARVLPVPARRGRRRSSRCPTTRPATSTSRPTWPRKSGRTWSTPSRRSASASRRPTTRWRPASTRSTSSTPTPCTTADNAVTFKFALKAIAQLHGLYATFMPKPIHGINGSGMHAHQRLYSIADKKNAFADPTNPYGLSTWRASTWPASSPTPAGMIAVLAPLVNSYKRLVPGYEAPTYLTWGRTNRSALIRVPKVSPGRSIEATRVEVRCPDPSSNTYLAFA